MSQTYFTARPAVQEDMPDANQHRRQIARGVNRLTNGHNNATLSVTLDPAEDTTVVTDARISLQTCGTLAPTTVNAAGALPTTYWVCEAGLMTIHHANNSQTDRTYIVSLIG